MCLILLATEPTKKYKFVMASNRDEFYSRPTESAHWWKEPQGFLAGKDLEPVSYTHLTLPTICGV